MEVTFVLSKAQLNKMRNGKGIIVNQNMITRSGDGFSDYASTFEAGKNFLIDSGLAQAGANYAINKASGNKKGKKIANSAADGLISGLRAYDVSDTNNVKKNGKNAALTGAFSAYNSYKGKGFLDDVKSAGKSITKTANKAGKSIKGGYSKVNKWALKNDIGGKLESVKQLVPPEVVNESIKLSLIAGGMDSKNASLAAGSATGTLYNVNFGKSLKGQGDEALQGAASGAMQGALMNSAYSGDGLGRARTSMKGTQEMRDRMARVRAGRGFKGSSVGSGFRD